MSSLNKRLKKGEPTAFAELYELLGDKLFRYFYSRLGSNSDASDIVQNTFVRLVKSHRALSQADNLSGYIFATARTELIRWREKQQRVKKTQNKFAQQAETNSTDRCELEGIEWVNNILTDLDSIDAEIVRLKAISQLTFREVAAALQMNDSSVATRYRRAMKKLSTKLSNIQINASQP